MVIGTVTKETINKATFIVIARLDRAIQNTLKILDSRLRGNDGTWGLTYGLLSNCFKVTSFSVETFGVSYLHSLLIPLYTCFALK